jgi:hypothetical protein
MCARKEGLVAKAEGRKEGDKINANIHGDDTYIIMINISES